PERTVFGITQFGREEFRQRLLMLLTEPSDEITFFVALSLMAGITRDEAVAALRRRVGRLEGRIARIAAQLASLRTTLPRLVLVEVEFQGAAMTAELAWVRTIIDDAESGALSWELQFDPTHPPN
ncbi:MAG: Transcriptional regulator, PadR family, partial [Thermoleophilia bacterium]|nr:Transcriptional regulator, PadR family [Thermoleophilia bacterium]